MALFSVTREIHFSYGHRLLNYQGKCANIHGHNGRLILEFSSPKLDHQNMVIDFYKIKEVMGAWVQNTIDHKLILWEKDPLAKLLQKSGETFVLIKENPTAEALAKWIYEEARKKRLPISKVTLWETENSCATYENSSHRSRRMRKNSPNP